MTLCIIKFDENDIVCDIIRKHAITPSEARFAILAWAYTVARKNAERDELLIKLDDAFKMFRRAMIGVDRNKMKEIYNL